MVLTWHGFFCFKIESQQAIVVLDPYDSSGGLRPPRFFADIVVITQNIPLANYVSSIRGTQSQSPFIIQGPGEYEIKNVFIHAIPTITQPEIKKTTQKVLCKLTIEDLKVVTLGGLNRTLADQELEILEGPDILLLPVGGQGALDGKQATTIISQLEPRVVIPMYYKIPGIKPKLDSLDIFKKEIGIVPEEETPKFRISKKDLPSEMMKVVIVKP